MRYETQKARRHFHCVPDERMTREMIYYETSATTCLCGETVFGSAMYRTDIICSHRMAHWYRDPRHPSCREGGMIPPDKRAIPRQTYALIMAPEWSECVLTVDDYQSAAMDPGNEVHVWEVDRLVKRIAQDARFPVRARGDQIRAWVEAHFWVSDEFAVGESLSFLDLCQKGVIYIRDAAAQEAQARRAAAAQARRAAAAQPRRPMSPAAVARAEARRALMIEAESAVPAPEVVDRRRRAAEHRGPLRI
jgi:hypothetical protein